MSVKSILGTPRNNHGVGKKRNPSDPSGARTKGPLNGAYRNDALKCTEWSTADGLLRRIQIKR